MKAVVKVGGSLQDSPALRDVCKTLDEMSKRHEIVVVPGGGEFANSVRKVQDIQGISDETAHLMAVMAMDVYGLALGELTSKLTTTDGFDELEDGSRIFLSFKRVSQDFELERSWRVTSDSLAAWVCGEIDFDELVLIKRVDGVTVEGKFCQEISTRELRDIDQTVVDPNLPDLLKKYEKECRIVNGDHPERIEKLLDGEKVLSTRIFPEVED